MNRVMELTENYYGVADGELTVEGIKVSDIVEEYGTPFYLYCPAIFREKLRRLQKALKGFKIYYSVKANPNPEVIRFFVDQGCGLEIASAGELYAALSCGCRPVNIIFAGPGKTESEIIAAVESQIGEIHVESVAEIERVAAVARQRNLQMSVSLRINPGQNAQAGAVQMGGKPSAFGIEEGQLAQAVKKVMGCENLILKGLHIYVGTQILDDKALLEMYRYAFDLAGSIADLSGQPIETIDFGGGLGVPYFEHETELDIESFGNNLRGVINENRSNHALSKASLVIEPGRYLTAEGGLYVAGVVDRKSSFGLDYVILDGGMNHHLAASGNLGQIIKRNYPLAVANRISQECIRSVNIAGPLCTPIDTLGRNVLLPEIEAGDVIAFFMSGAYGLSSSPTGFLSHGAPLELFVTNGEVHVIRKRGTYSDLFAETSIEKLAFEEVADDID
ncbi:MAG: diaminopimelate decarboxylase [Planctomycetes bacterium]|nr:diaminopimelate decarboxylase [Planctomycetota bacterium]